MVVEPEVPRTTRSHLKRKASEGVVTKKPISKRPVSGKTSVRAPRSSASVSIPPIEPPVQPQNQPIPGAYINPEVQDPRFHAPDCFRFYKKILIRPISTGSFIDFECCKAIFSIRRFFDRQEWLSFLSLRCPSYAFPIRCFYANMQFELDEVNPFPIRTYFMGRDIEITADLLASVLNVPNSGLIVAPYNLKTFPSYPDNHTPEKASHLLHLDRDPKLITSPNTYAMTFFAQVFAKILMFSAIPKIGGRDLIPGCFKLVIYCILSGQKINLPHLIGWHMRSYYRSSAPKKTLPYGRVITKILEHFGLDLSSFPASVPDVAFNQRNLNLMKYTGDLNEALDPDYVHPDEEDAPTPPTSPQSRVPSAHQPSEHHIPFTPGTLPSSQHFHGAGTSSSVPRSSAETSASVPPPPSFADIPFGIPHPFFHFGANDATQPIAHRLFAHQVQDATYSILNAQIMHGNFRATEIHSWLQMIFPSFPLPPPVIFPLLDVPAPTEAFMRHHAAMLERLTRVSAPPAPVPSAAPPSAAPAPAPASVPPSAGPSAVSVSSAPALASVTSPSVIPPMTLIGCHVDTSATVVHTTAPSVLLETEGTVADTGSDSSAEAEDYHISVRGVAGSSDAIHADTTTAIDVSTSLPSPSVQATFSEPSSAPPVHSETPSSTVVITSTSSP